jgi:Flp pilus assembly protein TadD
MSALILTKQGKTDQAIAEYKDLLAKQPKAIGAYMGLGSIYEQTGKTDLAKEAYTEILTIKPDFAPAANNLAWMIAESKDPDLGEALRLAMTAKQQQPDDAHIIDTLGWVHYKRGSFSLARNEFTQAVLKQEEMPILRYHLALALYGEGKKQEAIKELEKALSQNKPFEEKDEAAATLEKWRREQ